MRLVITEKAEKDLAGLDRRTSQRIRDAFDVMITNVNMVDLKKLKGTRDRWRLRVGDYRVLLQIVGDEATVYALRVKHRKEAYK
ncbi:hypothetical protein SY88_19390 [Clostridiales bacterium PH28_bin88]|nr:hypothetical protein SY88_19390 [Clostridiales bacterium PH28_bin88]